MIDNGSIITYVGTWPHGIFQTADSVVQAVIADLTSDGLLSVSPPNVDASLGTTVGAPFTVTLQLQVQNGLGFDQTVDIVNIIRHEVFKEASAFPLSDSVPYVQPPHGGAVATGQPGVSAPPSKGCISGTSTDTTGSWSLSCWWDNLTTKGLSTVGLLAIAITVGIGIFIFSASRPRVTV